MVRALVTAQIIADYPKIMKILAYWFWHGRLGSWLNPEDLAYRCYGNFCHFSRFIILANMDHIDELQTLCFYITKNFQKFKNNCNKE